MRRVRGLLAAMLLLAGVLPGGAPRAAEDGVTARLAAPEQQLTVGDPVVLKLTVTHPPGTVFDYPDASRLVTADQEGEGAGKAAGAPFVVEDVRPVEARPPVAGETAWAIRLRVFAPGAIEIPALTLTYRLAGSDEDRQVATEPLTLEVESVLKEADETPAGIKPPWWLPASWWVRILVLAVIAVLLAGGWIAWRRYRSRKGSSPQAAAAVDPATLITPYERALKELERLLASRILEEGKLKEFHVILSELVKRFLGAHHGFDALDRTSEEVLADLARHRVDPDTAKGTRLFLGACDLVKFAKYRPSRPEIDATVEAARALIETGRPAPVGREEAAA